MNTVNDKGFRGFAIAAVLLFGVVTTIASCGGGSDGRSIVDPVAPPVTIGPSLGITTQNGFDVSSTVVVAIGASLDLGDLGSDGLPIMAIGSPVAAADHKADKNFYAKLLRRDAEALESCAISGTVDITMTVTDPNTLTIGDRVVAVFTSCDDGDGYVTNGTVDLTIADVQGDIFTDVFLVEMDITLVDLSIMEETDTVTADGDVTLTIDSLDFPVVVLSIAGSELALGSSTDALTLTDFDHYYQLDMGVFPSAIMAGAEGRLESESLGGTVDYETPVPVQASGESDPSSGEILITGADGSTVRIIIVDSTHVTLEIDENGDNVIDEYVDTTWAELNGETSVVDPADVPVLAREVYNGVTGFAALATTAGGQFEPLGVFGQLEAFGVASEFGPVQIGCETGGTADVSGTKFTPTTFTAGDEFDTTFTACANASEILYGDMSFAVTDFDEGSVDTYLVSGTVTETDLQRTLDERCFTGNGVLGISHDQMLSSTGVADVRSSTDAFTVFAGGRDQRLSDAAVTAQISVGQSPVTVTQSSVGRITSPDLDGAYRYESITPFVFVIDDNVDTWAYSGELLVTASDGSTMRMIAVDELYVDLEIDSDGDSGVDEVIETTWAALSYPPWICDPDATW